MSDSLYGPSVKHSTWRRVAMSDSGQLIKRGTTHPASYEKLLRGEAPLGQLARLEPLQPDAPLCKLPVLVANPSCAHRALALQAFVTQPVVHAAQPSLVKHGVLLCPDQRSWFSKYL